MLRNIKNFSYFLNKQKNEASTFQFIMLNLVNL